MALALYLVVAAATLAIWNRYVTPLTRLAAFVVPLAPFPFAGPALVMNRVYGGHDMIFMTRPWSDYSTEYPHNWFLLDQALQLAPWQHAVRRALAAGQWPLWNPGMNAGDILAAGMQPAPLNPINVIGLVLPLDLAFTFAAAMVFFLTALFTFAFARELGCGEPGSLVAAAGYAWSSAVVFWSGWTHLGSWGVLPFVLLAVRRIVRNHDFRSWMLLVVALVLLIVFGHPETLLHVVTIGAVYGIFELVPVWRRAGRPIVLAITAAAVALLLTAVILLPFVAVLRSTWEYHVYKDFPLSTPKEIARVIGATFIPYYGGASWHNLTAEWNFGQARVGSILLALAVVCAFRVWRDREVRFFVALAVVALLAGFGAPPVATWLRRLPLFDVAKNDRLAFAAAFALAVLAGIAWEKASRSHVIILAVAATLAIATAMLWQKRLSFGVEAKLMWIGAAAEMIGIALLVIALGIKRPRVAIAVLLAAITAQRLVEDGGIYPALTRDRFYPELPLIRKVPRDPLYRVSATGNLLVPNTASMFGLEDVRGYSVMTDARFKKTTELWSARQKSYHDISDLNRPFLSFLGVRYALTPREDAPPPGWRVIADDRNTRLVESDHALPRVFVPRFVRFMNDDDIAMEEMKQENDFAEKAWIDARDILPQDVPNGEADVRVRRTGSRYDIDVDASSDAFVVISETSWPGWRAYVDGKRVRTQRANVAFLAVHVPAGKHRLRLLYRPEAFVNGRAISLSTLGLLFAARFLNRSLACRSRARRSAASSPSSS